MGCAAQPSTLKCRINPVSAKLVRGHRVDPAWSRSAEDAPVRPQAITVMGVTCFR